MYFNEQDLMQTEKRKTSWQLFFQDIFNTTVQKIFLLRLILGRHYIKCMLADTKYMTVS